jgi:hypothetical protein
MAMAHHYESSVTLAASPETAFVRLDDFRKLSAHMEKPSAMTLGSKMSISDYDLPQQGIGRWLGKLFGNAYARWCTKRMASDAAAAFRADVQVRRHDAKGELK